MYLKSIKETGNLDAYNNLGTLYYQQKKYDKAEQMYLQAIERGNDMSYKNLGLVYYIQNRYPDAKKYFKIGAEKGDQEAAAYYNELLKAGF